MPPGRILNLLSPNEEAELIQKESYKRRVTRLVQVRELSKKNARSLRKAVKEEKRRQILSLAEQAEEEWEREKENRMVELVEKYAETLGSVGEGHEAATLQKPRDEERVATMIADNKKAEVRYRTALATVKEANAVKAQVTGAATMNKHLLAEKERLRAKHVASLPPTSSAVAAAAAACSEKRHRRSTSGERRVLVTDGCGAASTTCVHGALRAQNWTVERESEHMRRRTVSFEDEGNEEGQRRRRTRSTRSTQPWEDEREIEQRGSTESDEEGEGMVGARERQAEYDEEQEGRLRELSEQREKARLRHKYALRKETMRKDHDLLLAQLEVMERDDRRRRQKTVDKLPRSVYDPPHLTRQNEVARQKAMCKHFEDLCIPSSGDLVGLRAEVPSHADTSGTTGDEGTTPVTTEWTESTSQSEVATETPTQSSGQTVDSPAGDNDDGYEDDGYGGRKPVAKIDTERKRDAALNKLIGRIKGQHDQWINTNNNNDEEREQRMANQDGANISQTEARSPSPNGKRGRKASPAQEQQDYGAECNTQSSSLGTTLSQHTIMSSSNGDTTSKSLEEPTILTQYTDTSSSSADTSLQWIERQKQELVEQMEALQRKKVALEEVRVNFDGGSRPRDSVSREVKVASDRRARDHGEREVEDMSEGGLRVRELERRYREGGYRQEDVERLAGSALNRQLPSATETNRQLPSATETNRQLPSATESNRQLPSAAETSGAGSLAAPEVAAPLVRPSDQMLGTSLPGHLREHALPALPTGLPSLDQSREGSTASAGYVTVSARETLLGKHPTGSKNDFGSSALAAGSLDVASKYARPSAGQVGAGSLRSSSHVVVGRPTGSTDSRNYSNIGSFSAALDAERQSLKAPMSVDGGYMRDRPAVYPAAGDTSTLRETPAVAPGQDYNPLRSGAPVRQLLMGSRLQGQSSRSEEQHSIDAVSSSLPLPPVYSSIPSANQIASFRLASANQGTTSSSHDVSGSDKSSIGALIVKRSVSLAENTGHQAHQYRANVQPSSQSENSTQPISQLATAVEKESACYGRVEVSQVAYPTFAGPRDRVATSAYQQPPAAPLSDPISHSTGTAMVTQPTGTVLGRPRLHLSPKSVSSEGNRWLIEPIDKPDPFVDNSSQSLQHAPLETEQGLSFGHGIRERLGKHGKETLPAAAGRELTALGNPAEDWDALHIRHVLEAANGTGQPQDVRDGTLPAVSPPRSAYTHPATPASRRLDFSRAQPPPLSLAANEQLSSIASPSLGGSILDGMVTAGADTVPGRIADGSIGSLLTRAIGATAGRFQLRKLENTGSQQKPPALSTLPQSRGSKGFEISPTHKRFEDLVNEYRGRAAQTASSFQPVGGSRVPPGGPDHTTYPGGPGHNVYPGGPGHNFYPGGPGHNVYPGGPGHNVYPGRPGHNVYPGGPGHNVYPGGHNVYPGGHNVYPGGPGHTTYPAEGAQGVDAELIRRAASLRPSLQKSPVSSVDPSGFGAGTSVVSEPASSDDMQRTASLGAAAYSGPVTSDITAFRGPVTSDITTFRGPTSGDLTTFRAHVPDASSSLEKVDREELVRAASHFSQLSSSTAAPPVGNSLPLPPGTSDHMKEFARKMLEKQEAFNVRQDALHNQLKAIQAEKTRILEAHTNRPSIATTTKSASSSPQHGPTSGIATGAVAAAREPTIGFNADVSSAMTPALGGVTSSVRGMPSAQPTFTRPDTQPPFTSVGSYGSDWVPSRDWRASLEPYTAASYSARPGVLEEIRTQAHNLSTIEEVATPDSPPRPSTTTSLLRASGGLAGGLSADVSRSLSGTTPVLPRRERGEGASAAAPTARNLSSTLGSVSASNLSEYQHQSLSTTADSSITSSATTTSDDSASRKGSSSRKESDSRKYGSTDTVPKKAATVGAATYDAAAIISTGLTAAGTSAALTAGTGPPITVTGAGTGTGAAYAGSPHTSGSSTATHIPSTSSSSGSAFTRVRTAPSGSGGGMFAASLVPQGGGVSTSSSLSSARSTTSSLSANHILPFTGGSASTANQELPFSGGSVAASGGASAVPVGPTPQSVLATPFGPSLTAEGTSTPKGASSLVRSGHMPTYGLTSDSGDTDVLFSRGSVSTASAAGRDERRGAATGTFTTDEEGESEEKTGARGLMDESIISLVSATSDVPSVVREEMFLSPSAKAALRAEMDSWGEIVDVSSAGGSPVKHGLERTLTEELDLGDGESRRMEDDKDGNSTKKDKDGKAVQEDIPIGGLKESARSSSFALDLEWMPVSEDAAGLSTGSHLPVTAGDASTAVGRATARSLDFGGPVDAPLQAVESETHGVGDASRHGAPVFARPDEERVKAERIMEWIDPTPGDGSSES